MNIKDIKIKRGLLDHYDEIKQFRRSLTFFNQLKDTVGMYKTLIYLADNYDCFLLFAKKILDNELEKLKQEIEKE